MRFTGISYFACFCFVSLLCGLNQSAYSQAISNKTNPNWTVDDDWTTGTAPGYTTSIDVTLAHDGTLSSDLTIGSGSTITINIDRILLVNSPVIIQSGGKLLIHGEVTSSSSILVENGGELEIFGLLAGLGTSEVLTVESGSTVKIENAGGIEWLGSMIWSGTTTDFDGSVELGTDLTVTTGSIAGTGNIFVNGTLDNSGNIFGCVDPNDDCCGSAQALFKLEGSGCLTPDYSVITSVASGNWEDDATWSGGQAPKDQDDVIIDGHEVLIATGKGPKVHNLTIQTNGELSQDNNKLEVKGNYTNNGVHNISKKELIFKSDDTTIDGVGVINLSDDKSKLKLEDDQTILSSADLLIFADAGSDGVEIKKDKTVNNFGSIQMAAEVTGNDGTWVQENGSDLYLFENKFEPELDARNSFNVVHYSDVADQELVETVDSEYNNLIIGGGGIKTLTENITITNFLVINGTLDVDVDEDYDIIIGGDWINKGTFLEQEAKVTFNGDGNSEMISDLGDATFYDMELNFNSGENLDLFANVLIENEFTMTKGNIVANDTERVELGTSTTNLGTLTYSEGHVSAPFKLWVTTGDPVTTFFPLGKGLLSFPLIITSPVYTAGAVTVEFVNEDPGNAGSPWTEGGPTYYNTFTDGYFVLTPDGTLLTDVFEVNIDLTNFSAFAIGGTETVVTRPDNGTDWGFTGTVGNIVGGILTRTALSEVQIALVDEANCTIPAAPSFSASDVSVCLNDSGDEYTVVADAGVESWDWVVTGGEITAGQTTNSILVTWGDDGIIGSVEASAVDDDCGTGPLTEIDVNILPLTTSSIAGRSILVQNSSDEVYSVTNEGYTYAWDISGGTIDLNNNDNITIDWGEAGNGSISVVADAGGGCSTASAELLDITLFSTYTSIASGDYDAPATWEAGDVPIAGADVRIAAGHTVTLVANATINNLVIDATATLDTDNFTLTLNNLLELDGTIDASTFIDGTLNNITLNSSTNNAIILGSGSINADRFEITSGVWTVVPSASVTANLENIGLTAAVLDVQGSLTLSGANTVFSSTGNFYASTVGSRITYAGTGGVQFILVPEDAYHDVSFAGTGTHSLTGDITVDGDFLDLLGTFAPNENKVVFSGDVLQTISGLAPIEFDDIDFNNTSGLSPSITVSTDIEIDNAATLSTGVVEVQGSNSLKITSTGTITGGSTANYIDGKLDWFLASDLDYVFPIGDGAYYSPVEINPTGLAGNFDAQYFASAYSDLAIDAGSSIVEISSFEHWIINDNLNQDADLLRLFYNDESFSHVETAADLRVSRHDGTDWSELGFHSGASGVGTSANGDYISLTNVTDFSPFTFGDVTGLGLPVDYSYFNAQWVDQNIKVTWATFTELNNDKFLIEHSLDGSNFQTIGEVNGKGTSNELQTYSFLDANKDSREIQYYRLKQVDFDGGFEYSKVIKVQKSSDNKVLIYPNPGSGLIFLQTMDRIEKVEIHDINGNLLILMDQETTINKVDISSLPDGMYILSYKTEGGVFHERLYKSIN